jgi:hypothetical protein
MRSPNWGSTLFVVILSVYSLFAAYSERPLQYSTVQVPGAASPGPCLTLLLKNPPLTKAVSAVK